MSDVQFIDGLRVYKPHERAPAWVKADLILDVGALYAWWQERGEEANVRLQIRESRKGTYYACLNTRNEGQQQRQEQTPQQPAPSVPPPTARDEAHDDLGELPF